MSTTSDKTLTFFLDEKIADQTVRKYGFKSLEELQKFKNVADYRISLRDKRRKNGKPVTGRKIQRRSTKYTEATLAVAKHIQASRSEAQTRDPVLRSLRHLKPPTAFDGAVSVSEDEDPEYVDAGSIQSAQSPAAYLAYIYDMAGKITYDKDVLLLDKRRPDLATFVMSDENLKETVTTLQVVNEILSNQLDANGVDTSGMPDDIYPFALPFHEKNCVVRACLRQVQNRSLNTIGLQTSYDSFGIGLSDFTMVPNPVDRLRLYTRHASLFASDPNDDDDLYMNWFGLTESGDKSRNWYMQKSNIYCKQTGLSFDEYRQMLRQDVNVSDESGVPYPTVYAQFINLYWKVDLIHEDDGTYRTSGTSPSGGDPTDIPSDVHENQNKCIRIQRRLGWQFYELDWLLTNAAPPYTSSDWENSLFSDEQAIPVLAHAVEWMEKYDLSVDQFTAIIGDINCYRREGLNEETLMRQLFGSDAALVTEKTRRYDPKDAVKISEIENDGFGDILRKGFKLNKSDWDAVLDAIDGSADNEDPVFTNQEMGRIYRVTTVIRLMKWSIQEGLSLLNLIDDKSVLKNFSQGTIPKDILGAIDRISWLSDWMTESDFLPTDVITILTIPSNAVIYMNQALENWLSTLTENLSKYLVEETDFTSYTEWGLSDPISTSDWMQELEDDGTIDEDGLIRVANADIDKSLSDFLKGKGVDLDQNEDNSDQLSEMEGMLHTKNNSQCSCLDDQVRTQASDLPPGDLNVLYKWMITSRYELNACFFNWTSATRSALENVFNLSRHVLVINKLSLSYIEMSLPGEHPTWIGNDMDAALSLKQVYLLSRFKWVQNDDASAEDWISYLSDAQEQYSDISKGASSLTEDNENCTQRLAYLIDWPENDVESFATADDSCPIGEMVGFTITIEQTDYVFRCVDTCRDLNISEANLDALKSCNGVENARDWTGASGAARLIVQSFSDGQYAATAEGIINEEVRDALVGSYLYNVAAQDEDIKNIVTNSTTLYEYLLIDVNDSYEVPTTRLLENTGAIQLYINRNLEQMEPGTIPDRENFRKQWDGAQQYRVWQAYAELQLYPCDYVDPEIRNGQTDIFADLDRALTKGELTPNIVNQALYSYDSSLQHLSELKNDGFFFTRFENKVVYFLTATASWKKRTYYYRKLTMDRTLLSQNHVSGIQWEQWTQANVSVSQSTVYGMYPAFAWGRLHLFWFEENTQQSVDVSEQISETKVFLVPCHSRQNLDGSFSDPFSPSYNAKDVNLVVSDTTSGGGQSSLHDTTSPLTVFQPYLSLDNNIYVYFLDCNGSLVCWALSEDGTKNDIEKSDKTTPTDDIVRINGFDTIPNGANYFGNTEMKLLEPNLQADEQIATITHDGYGGAITVVFENCRWTLTNKQDKIHVSMDCDSATVTADPTVTIDMSFNVTIESEGGNGGWCDLFTRSGTYSTSPTQVSGPFHSDSDLILSNPDETSGAFDCGFAVSANFNDGQFESWAYSTVVSCPFEETSYSTFLMCGNTGSTKSQQYLLSKDDDLGSVVVSCFSTAINNTTKCIYPGADTFDIFALSNQEAEEIGVQDFLDSVQASNDLPDLASVQPSTHLDFYGPYGIYAWEMFLYIPSLIASRYSQANKYDEARQWLEVIYDPREVRGQEWGMLPLINPVDLFVPLTDDPDEVARYKPIQYQIAVIRQFLQILIDQGDGLYRQETTEALRTAKMYYVTAQNLFDNSAEELTNVTSLDTWINPMLGEVVADNFEQPVNQMMKDLYSEILDRLDNLRHWRSIDGQPLNIPLIAPPIDPKTLTAGAISESQSSPQRLVAQAILPIRFEKALERAKAATRNFMALGELLYRGLREKDEDHMVQLRLNLEVFVTKQYDLGGQKSLIQSMEMELDALQSEKDEANSYKKWYDQFATEYMNPLEGSAVAMLSTKVIEHGMVASTEAVAGGLKLIPTIFGFSDGGFKPEGPAESAAKIIEETTEAMETSADIFSEQGEYLRRQQENQMEAETTAKEIATLGKSIDKLKYDISQEKGTKDVLKTKLEKVQKISDFHKTKTTNQQFYKWYVGQVMSLYGSAYDITVKFCRLAEDLYNKETHQEESFISPSWDPVHFGLLCGQSLMLDLEQMEYSFLQTFRPMQAFKKSVSLKSKFPIRFRGLKDTGRMLFTLPDEIFEELGPNRTDRRIKGVRMELKGIDSIKEEFWAQLKLVGHRVAPARKKTAKKRKSGLQLFGRDSLHITAPITDTENLYCDMGFEGRIGLFERCGVESTWLLVFPAIVAEKKHSSPQRRILSAIEDIVMSISYTCRTD